MNTINPETRGTVLPANPAYVNSLYNQYAAMLLGYIFEVVKNMAVAEQYLIAVFKEVPDEIDEITRPGGNAFCALQLMAKRKLTSFFDTVDDCKVTGTTLTGVANANNRYIGIMTGDQQRVFCGIYWNGKTVSTLAIEMEKTEDAVRRILKECFTTIRNSRR